MCTCELGQAVRRVGGCALKRRAIGGDDVVSGERSAADGEDRAARGVEEGPAAGGVGADVAAATDPVANCGQRSRETEAERQRGREAERQRGKEAKRQSGREAER